MCDICCKKLTSWEIDRAARLVKELARHEVSANTEYNRSGDIVAATIRVAPRVAVTLRLGGESEWPQIRMAIVSKIKSALKSPEEKASAVLFNRKIRDINLTSMGMESIGFSDLY